MKGTWLLKDVYLVVWSVVKSLLLRRISSKQTTSKREEALFQNVYVELLLSCEDDLIFENAKSISCALCFRTF